MNRIRMELISRSVLLELWRRQDVWILLMLMGVFTVMALMARFMGLDDQQAAAFMLNLGMSLSSLFAHLLCVLMISRQIPQEIENRTLYPLLAKPLGRAELLFGKWMACSTGAMIAFVCFFLISWAASPFLEDVYMGTMVQHVLLQPVSIAGAGALALLMSLVLPRGLALTASLALVFVSGTVHQWGQTKTPLVHVLPRFDAMNLSTRFTDGIAPLSHVEWVQVLVFGITWACMCFMASVLIFRGKAL